MVMEKFTCAFEQNCNQTFEKINTLKEHAAQHFRRSSKMLECIYDGCSSLLSTYGSFKYHLNTHHKNDALVKSKFLRKDNFEAEENENNNNNRVENDYFEFPDMTEENETAVYSEEPIFFDAKQIQDVLIKIYIKYHGKFAIPQTICDEIFGDMIELIDLNAKIQINNINTKRKQKNLELNEIIKTLNENTLIHLAYNKFRTNVSKINYLKKMDFYVEPKTEKLANKSSFNYIPLIKNIKSMLSNKKIKAEYFKKLPDNELRFISCFSHSRKFKDNPVFQKDRHALQLKFFIDDFDLNNPLGDKRKKNKLCGVYYKYIKTFN